MGPREITVTKYVSSFIVDPTKYLFLTCFVHFRLKQPGLPLLEAPGGDMGIPLSDVIRIADKNLVQQGQCMHSHLLLERGSLLIDQFRHRRGHCNTSRKN